MATVAPLLFAAALVGTLHMSAPDHWATLVILGRNQRWAGTKLLRMAIFTGLGHILLTFALALAIVTLGLIFSKLISFYFAIAVGIAMVGGGLYIGSKALFLKSKRLTRKSPTEDLGRTLKEGFSYFAVLGAALSPDLSIMPIFLYAVTIGTAVVLDTAVIFAVTSLLTIVLLTFIGSMGLAMTLERIPSKYSKALTGFVIAAVGFYILIFA